MHIKNTKKTGHLHKLAVHPPPVPPPTTQFPNIITLNSQTEQRLKNCSSTETVRFSATVQERCNSDPFIPRPSPTMGSSLQPPPSTGQLRAHFTERNNSCPNENGHCSNSAPAGGARRAPEKKIPGRKENGNKKLQIRSKHTF